jgi:hypothetical protein
MARQKSNCTSRPDCPRDFCVKVCAEIADGRTEKDQENKIAEDFLRSLRTLNDVRTGPRSMEPDRIWRELTSRK